MIIFALSAFKTTQKNQNRLLLISCLMWIFVFGLRGYGVQNDTSAYATFISGKQYGLSMYITDYGTVDNPSEDIEIGYVLFGKLFSFFSTSPTFFFLLVSTWLFSLVYFIYKKSNPENSVWCLLLFFTVFAGTVSVLMGSMRQVLSFCFLLSGCLLLQNVKADHDSNTQKVKWYKNYRIVFSVVLLVYSILVHRSAIMSLSLFLLAYFIKINKFLAYLLLSTAFLISIYFNEFLGAFLDLFFTGITNSSNEMLEVISSRYGDLDDEGISVMARFTRFFVAIVVTYFIDKDNQNTVYYRCFVIATILFLIFSTSFIVNRITMVFYLLGCAIIIPKDIKINTLAKVIYVALTLVFTYKTYVLFDNWPVYKDSFLPYYFFWE